MDMPSEASFISWALKGLGGAVTILEKLVEHGPRINGAQFDELAILERRLYNVTHAFYERRIDLGAEYHGPETDPYAVSTAGSTDGQSKRDPACPD